MSAKDEHRKRIEEALAQRGDLYMEVDGYYVYGNRRLDQGFLAAYDLRVIADILDEKNAAWDAQVQKDLGT